MLTNNFYKILLTHMNLEGATATITKYDGTTATVMDPSYVLNGLRYVRCAEFAAGQYGTYFGTGTTPPTMDDYNLESPILDGTLSSSSTASPQKGFEQDHARIYATHEVTNNSTSDVTVTEVGVFGAPSSSSKNVFMIDRTVLNTPITIPAGGSKSITIAIKFDYPAE